MNWLKQGFDAIVGPLASILQERERRRTRRVEVNAEAQARQDNRAAANDAARDELEAARERNDAAVQQVETEAARDWDLAAANAAATSWKDELWTIVAVIPIVLCFVPGLAPFVALGFQALNGAPGWFQMLVAASVSFSFGIRHVVQVMQNRWGRR